MPLLLGIISLALVFYFIFGKQKNKIRYKGPFPDHWKRILFDKVSFYRQLNQEQKQQFENRVMHFLNTTRITGIKTTVDISDELLVAASAVIPVFEFPQWEYRNLSEVLLYPSSFNEKFDTDGPGNNILGMVGTGYMEGKMILSKSALHKGFRNEGDKKNVGIHEFVHLIDKTDGLTDGIPEVLMKQPHSIPWLKLVREKMDEIHAGQSDVNPYGGVNPQEFYSVISEYFFERPRLLEQKHPELYHMLTEIFSVDLSKTYTHVKKLKDTGRNDPCPCGSGEKFKHCCGKLN